MDFWQAFFEDGKHWCGSWVLMFIDDFDFFYLQAFDLYRNVVNHNWLDLEDIAINHSLCILLQLCNKWFCCGKQAILSLYTSECFYFTIIVGFDTFNIILKYIFRFDKLVVRIRWKLFHLNEAQLKRLPD